MPIKRPGELLKINLTVPLWAILLITTIICIIIYSFVPQYKEDMLFYIKLFGGAAAIYSAYYIGASLRIGLEDNRKQRSFELLNLLNRPEFVRVRMFIEKEVKNHESLSPQDLYKQIIESEELLNSVTIVLGIFEDISIAIQYNHVDEEIMYKSVSTMIPWNFNCLRSYIEQERTTSNDMGYYIEIEKLVISWKNKKRLSDGKKLPALI